jgi:cation/acetate symporter
VGPDRIKLEGGANMSAPLLAETLGGPAFFGFLGAVAFATILAVVAGLTLAGASALSHDIWVGVVKKGHSDEKEQVVVARVATIVLGILAILLGILLKGQNVAFLVGLAFALAASANFPSLVLSILWKRFTTKGAVASTWTGIVVWLVLTVLSPTVWVAILKNKEAVFPLKSPGLFSMGAAFLAGIVVSLLSREPSAEAKFEEEKLRTYVGIGAD